MTRRTLLAGVISAARVRAADDAARPYRTPYKYRKLVLAASRIRARSTAALSIALSCYRGLFYLFYNAKTKTRPREQGGGWIEQTGVATSRDLKTWTRYEKNPLIPVGPKAVGMRASPAIPVFSSTAIAVRGVSVAASVPLCA
jgi:hypothetical protein